MNYLASLQSAGIHRLRSVFSYHWFSKDGLKIEPLTGGVGLKGACRGSQVYKYLVDWHVLPS